MGDGRMGDGRTGDGRGPAGTEDGRWLVDHRRLLDQAEAEELRRLVAFDRDQLWALDGFLNCAGWMVWYLGMARSTAFEKLRIGYELERRPVIAEAFADGRISYSMVRVLTRMERPDPDVDRALVELACSDGATITHLEQAVRAYRLYGDQDRPPVDQRPAIRGVGYRRAGDGMVTVSVTLTESEADEFRAVLQHFVDRRWHPTGPVDESPAGDCGPLAAAEPVDESPVAYSRPGVGPLDGVTRSAVRADAFLDLVATALQHAAEGAAAGDDRYMVHVVTRDEGRSFHTADGRAVHPLDAARISCDASTVEHFVSQAGDLLRLGRRTRRWSVHQRRGAGTRDGGHCRFPGCGNTIYDIHHIVAWKEGGRTDLDNAICACRAHHRLFHAGYRIEGHPDGELRFLRPDGSYLGSARPAGAYIPRLALARS